ncbi:sn-glycerol 3-phosphate transport system permease protein [Monaibacterium marinum]|uniref:sn-glycerol-3-phosphate transport system permease protein UgpE n=2 Tax=Pontivivens marinum TaxID=1690039 RepID=A0A2C9CWN5_9RHOB|nr:sn-glycerol 3-phosphate transport system permease protein [Monaibacterium marinum]
MTDTTLSMPVQVAPRGRRIRLSVIGDHFVLILGALFMMAPIYMTLTTASHENLTIHREGLQFLFGGELLNNFDAAMFGQGGFSGEITGMSMLKNSLILGMGFALGKIVLSMMAAYAIVYFRLRFATFAFWVIFTTLLLPLEVRIVPSYEVITGLGLANTYTGLIVPLLASATGTFFFRQYFLSIPEELVEAARIDGAGPVKFFIDILVPLSRTMIAAIFIVMFVYGWNQYLWPTLITTDEGLYTLVRGIKQIRQSLAESNQIPAYGQAMALSIIAILPPVLIVVFLQNWFIKGLVESDK